MFIGARVTLVSEQKETAFLCLSCRSNNGFEGAATS
jgi:hypothetical protein